MQVGYLCAGVLSVYLGLNWRAAIGFQVAFLFLLTAVMASFPREFVETPATSSGLIGQSGCAGFPSVSEPAAASGPLEGASKSLGMESAVVRAEYPPPSVIVEMAASRSAHGNGPSEAAAQQPARAVGDLGSAFSLSPSRDFHKRRQMDSETFAAEEVAAAAEQRAADALAAATEDRRAVLSLLTYVG